MVDLGLVCNCAVRYAFANGSYISAVVAKFIKVNARLIGNSYLRTIQKELEKELEEGHNGRIDPRVDVDVWEDLINFIKNYVPPYII